MRDKINQLNYILSGFGFFQAVKTAINTGFFAQICQKPQTFAKMAKLLQVEQYPLQVLTNVLQDLDLINVENGKISATEITNQLFNPNSIHNILPIVKAYDELMYIPMSKLQNSFQSATNKGLVKRKKNDTTIYDTIQTDSKRAKVFYEWMECIAKNPINLKFYLLSIKEILLSPKTILDIGSGDGFYSELVNKNFKIKKTILVDSNLGLKLAKKRLKKFDKNRVFKYWPRLPAKKTLEKEKIDLVLLNHWINIYSQKQNINLLKRCYRLLPKEGKVILYNSVLVQDQSKNLATHFLSLYFLTIATGEGRVYSIEAIKEMLVSAGFRSKKIDVKTTDASNHAFIVATK